MLLKLLRGRIDQLLSTWKRVYRACLGHQLGGRLSRRCMLACLLYEERSWVLLTSVEDMYWIPVWRRMVDNSVGSANVLGEGVTCFKWFVQN